MPQQFNSDLLPDTEGRDLGSTSQRWDVNARNLDVSGTLDFGTVSVENLNGVRFADQFCTSGVLDDGCIQRAINDVPDGGEVYISRGTYVISNTITIGKRLTLRGSGWGSVLQVAAGVSATTDIITVTSASILDGVRLQDFSIQPISGTPGRYGIHFDGSGNQIYNVVVDHVRILQLGSSAIRGDGSGGAQGTPFMSTIRNSELHGGISLPNAGDTISIRDNQITGTGIGVDASFQGGATTLIIQGNNITSDGGAIHLGTNVVSTKILDNEFETAPTFTGSNGALVDIDGAASPQAFGVVVEGNSFQVVNGIVANALRINQASQTIVGSNRFQRGVGASKDIVITSSALVTMIGPNYWEGSFTPADMISDAGSATIVLAGLSNSGVHGWVINNNRPLRFLNPAGTTLRTVLNYDASEKTNLFGYQERPLLVGDNGSTSIYDGTSPGTVRGLFNSSGLTVTGDVTSSQAVFVRSSANSFLDRSGTTTLLAGDGASGAVALRANGSTIVTVNDTGTVLGVGVGQGTGVKHGRVTTGSISAGASAAVTITWGGSAFANTNYTVICSVLEATTSTSTLRVHHIESVTTTTVVVRVVNDDGVSAHTGTLHAIAFHD